MVCSSSNMFFWLRNKEWTRWKLSVQDGIMSRQILMSLLQVKKVTFTWFQKTYDTKFYRFDWKRKNYSKKITEPRQWCCNEFRRAFPQQSGFGIQRGYAKIKFSDYSIQPRRPPPPQLTGVANAQRSVGPKLGPAKKIRSWGYCFEASFLIQSSASWLR